MKKSSLIQRYRRDIKEIDEELIRINERNNPKEEFVIDRRASRITTFEEWKIERTGVNEMN